MIRAFSINNWKNYHNKSVHSYLKHLQGSKYFFDDLNKLLYNGHWINHNLQRNHEIH